MGVQIPPLALTETSVVTDGHECTAAPSQGAFRDSEPHATATARDRREWSSAVTRTDRGARRVPHVVPLSC